MTPEQFLELDFKREKRERFRMLFGVMAAVCTLMLALTLGVLLIWHLYVDTPIDMKAFVKQHDELIQMQGRIVENEHLIERNQQILMELVIRRNCLQHGVEP